MAGIQRLDHLLTETLEDRQLDGRRRAMVTLAGFLAGRIFAGGQHPGAGRIGRSEGIGEGAGDGLLHLRTLGGEPEHEEERHHRGHEIRVRHFPCATSSFTGHGPPLLSPTAWDAAAYSFAQPDYFVFRAFNIASRSSAEGFTSVGRPRRATSTAITGAMPLAKPMTELAMQRL